MTELELVAVTGGLTDQEALDAYNAQQDQTQAEADAQNIPSLEDLYSIWYA